MKKVKLLLTVAFMGFAVLGMMASASADTITITPTTTPQWQDDDSTPNNPDCADIATIVEYEDTLFTLYKQEVDNGEEGGYAPFYETVFTSESGGPGGGTITWTGSGDDYMTGPLYLLVKDGVGAEPPIWYLFDLTALGWDGQETLQLSGFWPGKGAISHVQICGVPIPPTALLFATGLIGFVGIRRKLRKS